MSYEGVFLGYLQNSEAYVILKKDTMIAKEFLNITFDESPPPPKTSLLEDNGLVKEEVIKVELIRDIVFGLRSNQDYLSACLAHMMYCIVAKKQYNLAYFIAKRIEHARATIKANLPYGMLLTRLYRQVMDWYPKLDNGICNVIDRVMHPLAVVQARKPYRPLIKLMKTKKSKMNVPPEIALHTYLNSLSLLHHHVFKNPTTPEQNANTLFNRPTLLLNRQQQTHEEQHGIFKRFRKALKGAFTRKK
uniref:Ribosomal protein L7Ae/L30e/S12e/Gadd45 n=1 Tax=Tanacetum cinerariifolium TaxID=118510 RepID=A0A699GGX1_TANCI|nr:ribosomal protein L7Ae/L30e/S12e/Gadd45 [Tanacetum cinerariifolium]